MHGIRLSRLKLGLQRKSSVPTFSTLPLRGYIDGLILSQDAGDTNHDVNVAAGVCRNAANSNFIINTDITKKIDATWAQGDDAGGLNATDFAAGGSGTEPATWYHKHALLRDDGLVDAGFDKSVSAASLLSDAAVTAAGFSTFRRLGSVLTDSAGPPENIVPFTQHGDEFLWNSPPIDVDTAITSTAAQTATLTVPPDLKVWAIIQVALHTTDNTGVVHQAVWISSLDQTDEALDVVPAGERWTVAALDTADPLDETVDSTRLIVRTNTSRQIRYRAGFNQPNVRFWLRTIGWIDPRGRNA